MRKTMFVILALSIVMILAGCKAYQAPAAPEPLPPVESVVEEEQQVAEEAAEPVVPVEPEVTVAPEEVPEAPPVKEIIIKGSEFRFEPSTITVNKGDRVRLTFQNIGGIGHNVIIEGYGRTKTISGGGTDTIEFVADKTGTFAMWCSVANHRSLGMEGALVVR